MNEKMKKLKLYIYNDIAEYLPSLSTRYYRPSQKLVDELIYGIKKNDNVLLIERNYALKKIIRSYTHKPFEVTFALGKSGYIVAKSLHEAKGWFPQIITLPLKRSEVHENEFVIHSRFRKKVKQVLNRSTNRIAIVDDTLYSGLTVKTVLNQFNPVFIPKTSAFFLHALEDGLPSIAEIKNISAGLFIPGKREEEVSIIRASGLFQKKAIRRLRASSQAFYQRRSWMERWFPENVDEIIPVCRALSHMLEKAKLAIPDSFDTNLTAHAFYKLQEG